MSWFWVNEVVSDLIFPFSNDLLTQNERQADYRNLIVRFETKVMIYRKKLNFQDKKIAKSTEKKSHIQRGWKEPDSLDQKSCPILSNIVRFFPTLSGSFQCQYFQIRPITFVDFSTVYVLWSVFDFSQYRQRAKSCPVLSNVVRFFPVRFFPTPL